MSATHAAAYTQSGRDTGHALCGAPTGPVSTDWDDVDCEPCIRIHQSPASDETDDGFEQWHATHRARVTELTVTARGHLATAHLRIADVATALEDLREERCEFDCAACPPDTDLRDAEALIADAARLLRAASALTRPEPSAS